MRTPFKVRNQEYCVWAEGFNCQSLFKQSFDEISTRYNFIVVPSQIDRCQIFFWACRVWLGRLICYGPGHYRSFFYIYTNCCIPILHGLEGHIRKPTIQLASEKVSIYINDNRSFWEMPPFIWQ